MAGECAEHLVGTKCCNKYRSVCGVIGNVVTLYGMRPPFLRGTRLQERSMRPKNSGTPALVGFSIKPV